MLKGKNVIVTGATRGIGKEIALTLAQNGANIAINYRNYNDEIVELINALKEFGADVLAIKCDVSKSNEVENFVSEIKNHFSSIDILVNNAGIVGLIGNAGQSNYSASKAGVIGFSKSVAKELASRNININVVAPGYIDTDMTKSLPDRVKEEILKSIPMKKIGNPKEVANLVLFLSSNLSDYITGQVINVDGGMVMV